MAVDGQCGIGRGPERDLPGVAGAPRRFEDARPSRSVSRAFTRIFIEGRRQVLGLAVRSDEEIFAVPVGLLDVLRDSPRPAELEQVRNAGWMERLELRQVGRDVVLDRVEHPCFEGRRITQVHVVVDHDAVVRIELCRVEGVEQLADDPAAR